MKLKIIGAVAALAIAMPLATATPSTAQGVYGGGGGGAAAGGGGGGAAIGGGGGGGGVYGGRGGGGGAAIGGGGGRGGGPIYSGRPSGGGTAWHGGGRPGGGGWHGGGRPGGGGWHGGHRHRHGGFWPGVGTGLIIGGAIGAPYGYYDSYGPGYYDDDYYDAPAVTVAPGGDSVAYCRSRFKSYDVRTGTYLGYDGLRHPCP